MKTNRLWFFLLWWLGGGGSALAAEDGLTEPTRTFLEDNCFDCHDEQSRKGDLDLTSLKFDARDAAAFATWIKVHDRVRAGEMPPKKRTPPPAAERDAFVQALDAELSAANSAVQSAEGRAFARRLNRDEYQNSLRDLLGVREDYRGRLPIDGTANGFDKVGSALGVSVAHLQAYLAAAQAALDEAIATGPRPKTEKRLVPQRFADGDSWGKYPETFVNAPDALVRFAAFVDTQNSNRIGIKVAGIYHLRVKARAYQSTEPVIAAIHARGGGSYAARPTVLVDYVDFPPEGAVYETTQYLRPGERLLVGPRANGPLFGGGMKFTKEHTAYEYKGPGLAVEWIEVEGPLCDTWPSAAQQRLFGVQDLSKGTRADAERIVGGFAARAFRRPLREGELADLMALYDRRAMAGDFLPSIKVVLQAVLCSPQFLFLQAPSGPLDDFALAARLAYFLWSAPPDDTLIELARAGTLHQPGILQREVQRMLRDEKSAAFCESFTGQWLDLRKMADTAPDKQLYPEFDPVLEWSMVEETQRFFMEVLTQNLSVMNFVQSDFAILNQRLATHYGIAGVKGLTFRKVMLPPDSVRGGVLGQAAILKVTANGATSSPVLRGKWVMDHLLDQPPPPPPPGVGAVEPDIRGAKTIRDQLAKHRNEATCSACHAKIDPPGFALESFDVIGGWRDRYRATRQADNAQMDVVMPMTFLLETQGPRLAKVGVGQAVDSSGAMPGGAEFRDFREFRRELASDPDRLARALAAKLITYATGVPPQYADRQVIAAIAARAGAQGYGFRTLIEEVVQSPIFLRQ